MKIKKGTVNFSVDLIAFLLSTLLLSTGLLIHYTLPPGSGHFKTLWGLDRHAWGDVHFWMAIGLVVVIGVHLVLHWPWIVAMVKGKVRSLTRRRVWVACVGLVVLVAATAAPFFATPQVTPTAAGETSHRQQQAIEHDDMGIRGSMSVAEISQLSGVPAEAFKRELSLPADVSPDERMGRLGREFQFDMDRVREVIKDNSPEP
ncbi:DUF4405 domain-containing protein [Aeoliella sp. ICT_H6.2]|uniref:DUF4405 domain-containing protein n=1 Tax=Aeoliella straminimaris TaxID=2954799 RepID=A0A9X2JGW6_9BACT|nr:DUF4405 domain-containing protein [Aeoliella straminimaris]MCO6042299.1 DUF4405 domain-containing protein [Aeoliella straminimaris]